MRIKLEQLKQQLQPLKPIYIITGDEPLLIDEACRYIIKIAKQNNFTERQVIHAAAKFNWNELNNAKQSLSLFSEKKIIELHLPNGKPGTAGSLALLEYVAHLSAETLLILRLPKLPATSQQSKWFTTLEKLGVVINIWNITTAQLPHWISRRLARAKLNTSTQGLQMLATLSEGNLLAAKQNIEKLSLLYGERKLTVEQIETCLNDNAYYDIYTLLNSILDLNTVRSIKILKNLSATNVEATLILWVLTKEIRTLAQLAKAVEKGASLNDLWQPHGIWKQRQPLLRKHLTTLNYQHYLQLLQLAADCDQLAKGVGTGNIWLKLQQLVLQMCKVELSAA